MREPEDIPEVVHESKKSLGKLSPKKIEKTRSTLTDNSKLKT